MKIKKSKPVEMPLGRYSIIVEFQPESTEEQKNLNEGPERYLHSAVNNALRADRVDRHRNTWKIVYAEPRGMG